MGEGKIYWGELNDVNVQWNYVPLERDDMQLLEERMKKFWGATTVHIGLTYLDLMSEDFEVYLTFVGEDDFELKGILVPVVSLMGDPTWFYFAHDAAEWILEAKDRDPNFQNGEYDYTQVDPRREIIAMSPLEKGRMARRLGVYKEAIELFCDYYGMNELDPSDEEDDIIGEHMGRNV